MKQIQRNLGQIHRDLQTSVAASSAGCPFIFGVFFFLSRISSKQKNLFLIPTLMQQKEFKEKKNTPKVSVIKAKKPFSQRKKGKKNLFLKKNLFQARMAKIRWMPHYSRMPRFPFWHQLHKERAILLCIKKGNFTVHKKGGKSSYLRNMCQMETFLEFFKCECNQMICGRISSQVLDFFRIQGNNNTPLKIQSTHYTV